jgi:hypothetical protein
MEVILLRLTFRRTLSSQESLIFWPDSCHRCRVDWLVINKLSIMRQLGADYPLAC